jgi:tetratricopeptide (TPR) repeat protein
VSAAPSGKPADRISGVFSSLEIKKVGTGATQRTSKAKQYWLVNEQDNGQVDIQPINENMAPVGKKRSIRIEDLLERFEPEPEFYLHTASGVSRQQWDQLKAQRGPDKVEVDVAGFDLSGSPEDVEKSARAGFGLGLAYLRRGNPDKAREIFTRLAEVRADFTSQHKHMFSDFGMTLRKQSLLDVALKHHFRALDLDGEDENLHHNIARVYFEQNDLDNALKFLKRSLELNPKLEASRLFVRFIEKKTRPQKKGGLRLDI